MIFLFHVGDIILDSRYTILSTYFRSISPGKRYKKLLAGRDCLENNLPKTPYVKVRWDRPGVGEEDMIALVDTGADWSLMVEGELSEDEGEEEE